MAVPSLKLDLAPPSTFWRLNHGPIGWAALAAGGLLLAASLGLTLHAYRQAHLAGKRTVLTQARTRSTEATQQKVLEELRSVDVAKELPRWRLAERIYSERSLPWSRLTAELERSMVLDVRLKSLQRSRGSDMKVQLKVKGEARTRDAEAEFVTSLQKNPFFDQVVLEREAERQGGGVDFEYTLVAQTVPPPYAPLPKFGPQRKAAVQPAAAQARPGVRTAAARPAAAPQAPAAAPRPAPAATPQPAPAVPPAATSPGAAPLPRFPVYPSRLNRAPLPGQTNPGQTNPDQPLVRPRRPRPVNREPDE